MPARDGASTRFANLTPRLVRAGAGVQVYHCFRGWSSLDLIALQEFDTYFFPEKVFYGSPELLARLMLRNRVDILQANDLESMVSLGFGLAREVGCFSVMESHYHSSTLARQMGCSRAAIERLERLEAAVASGVDAIFVFTPQDRERWMFLTGADPGKVLVIPCGVTRTKPPAGEKSLSMAFLGNMYFEPNARALRVILDSILPGVREKWPGVRLRVIGDLPAAAEREIREAGVDVLGEVPDVQAELHSCALGLAPVNEGTGLRTKILDYLAAGLPVVATAVAAEGLAFPALFVRDSIDEMVKTCCELLSGDWAQAEVRQSQKMLEDSFLWETIAAQTAEAYAGIRRKERLPAPPPGAAAWTRPMWLAEVVDKGRFTLDDTEASSPYSYGLAGSGRIEYFS